MAPHESAGWDDRGSAPHQRRGLYSRGVWLTQASFRRLPGPSPGGAARSGFFLVLDVAIDQAGHIVAAFLLLEEGVLRSRFIVDGHVVVSCASLGFLARFNVLQRNDLWTRRHGLELVLLLDCASPRGGSRAGRRLEDGARNRLARIGRHDRGAVQVVEFAPRRRTGAFGTELRSGHGRKPR